MKKHALILFFLVFTTTLIFCQDVNINLKIPAKAKQNEEFEIKVQLIKGDITGFARLQFDFPEGFEVKSTQLQGATFSYKENKARYLWMSLPGESEININCIVKINSSATGNQQFEGVFSYVLNNETQRYNIPKQTITIEGAEVAVKVEKTEEVVKVKEEKSSQEAEQLEAERKARELAIAKAEEEKRERDEIERLQKEEAARKTREEALASEKKEAAIVEKVEEQEVITTEVAENTEDENLRLEQERKAREEAELIAEEKRLAELKAREEAERKAREAEEARLAEAMKNDENKQEETIIYTEEKSTENTEVLKKEEEVDNTEKIRKAQEEATARIEAERIAKETADKLEREKLEREKREKDEVAKQAELKRKAEEKAKTTPVAPTSANVDYRVQVGASRVAAPAGYYSKIDKNIAEFNVVENSNYDGWYRYTIGSFNNIAEAQNLLARVTQLGYSPFLAAFKDGKRIPINEAKSYLGK